MMKNQFQKIGISVIALSFTISCYATEIPNNCIANMTRHIINSETAWLDDCNLHDSDVPKIISYLNTHPTITQLYLINNHIGDKGALLLAKNKQIKMLELRNNNVGKIGALALSHSSIHMLDLQGNTFNDSNSVTLALNDTHHNNMLRAYNDAIILG